MHNHVFPCVRATFLPAGSRLVRHLALSAFAVLPGFCSSLSAGTVLHYDSNTLSISNVGDYLLVNASSSTGSNLVVRNQGSTFGTKTTYALGDRTGFYPTGWQQANNTVQLARSTGLSSAVQGHGNDVGWVTDADDLEVAPGTSGNCYTSLKHSFGSAEDRPRPWAPTQGKLLLTTRMRVHSAQFNNVIQHAKFEIVIRNSVQKQSFWFQDKFFHMGTNPPSDQIVHTDAVGNVMAIAKHTDASLYHTRLRGTYKSTAFTTTETFKISISRAELEKMIDDVNAKRGSGFTPFSKNFADYEVTMVNVNTEMVVGSGSGVSGNFVDQITVETQD